LTRYFSESVWKIILQLQSHSLIHIHSTEWSIREDFYFTTFLDFYPVNSINGQNRRWFCPAGRPGKGQPQKIPTCPVATFWACPVVPLSRDKKKSLSCCLLCPGTIKGRLSLCPAGQENPVLLETLMVTMRGRSRVFLMLCVQNSHRKMTNDSICNWFLRGKLKSHSYAVR